jgi:hypothetical protein
MLWIMTSPGRGIKNKDKNPEENNKTLQEEVHGEDHPGNQ